MEAERKTGMPCPECKHPGSGVIDSRPHKNGGIRRRRACAGCKARFTTIETVAVYEPRTGFGPAKIVDGGGKPTAVIITPEDLDEIRIAINRTIRAKVMKQAPKEEI